MKTASRILGTAFFVEGFEVQDAPRYGAERRGAPIFAYVRASRNSVNERGIIRRPDLIIVADETLVRIPGAGVMCGATERTVLLVSTGETAMVWGERLSFSGPVIPLPLVAESEDRLEARYIGAACAGAAARLVGDISREALERAIRDELASRGEKVVRRNLDQALEAYDLMAAHAGCVAQGEEVSPEAYKKPDWIDLPFEGARLSAPVIHGAATSEGVRTGLWRTMRPVIDYGQCNRCWWVCSTLCPDGTICVNEEGYPQLDYEHCKGCMICVAQCPSHAIRAVPEHEAASDEAGSAASRPSSEGGRS